MTTLILLLLGSYLLGSIPFGYWIARSRGVDIFQHGSGNIGATNVGRVLGRKYGILVFVLDFAKGAVAVLIAAQLEVLCALDWPRDSVRVLAGLASFGGHLFPIFLRFRGGKGVATAGGVSAVLLPVPMLCGLILWVAVVSVSRMVSLSSIAAAVLLCALRLLLPEPFARDRAVLTSYCLIVTAFVIVKHRSNIVRIRQGRENQLKDHPAMTFLSRVLHVVPLALWFGTLLFFTFPVALSLFRTFESTALSDERPRWFPPAEVKSNPEEWKEKTEKVPFKTVEQVRKEQGTRAAGAAIGPLFAVFYPLQGACGLLSLVTALGWPRLEPTRRVHRVRVWLLILAVLTVLAGWPLERKVATLGIERDTRIDKLLLTSDPGKDQIEDAAIAKRNFGLWHMYSLFLNFGTVALVTGAMILSVKLPAERENEPKAVPAG